MYRYLPHTIIAILTCIPVALMANNFLNGETIEWSKYIIPMISPAATGFIYYAQTKIRNGLDIFKIEVTHEVSKVQDGFSELKSDTLEMKEKLDIVKNDIHDMKIMDQLKKEFKTQLEVAAKESINLLEDDEYLKHFATLKTKAFIEYVIDIRDSIDSMNRDQFDMKKSQGICISDELRKEGYDILDTELVNKFYVKHEKKVVDFLNKVDGYILSDNVHKKAMFQDDCLKFLRQFVSDLDKTYIKFRQK